jgi:hypothetical protein
LTVVVAETTMVKQVKQIMRQYTITTTHSILRQVLTIGSYRNKFLERFNSGIDANAEEVIEKESRRVLVEQDTRQVSTKITEMKESWTMPYHQNPFVEAQTLDDAQRLALRNWRTISVENGLAWLRHKIDGKNGTVERALILRTFDPKQTEKPKSEKKLEMKVWRTMQLNREDRKQPIFKIPTFFYTIFGIPNESRKSSGKTPLRLFHLPYQFRS